jgi:hypothetical protein
LTVIAVVFYSSGALLRAGAAAKLAQALNFPHRLQAELPKRH